MPVYQLHVAVALSVALLGSAALFAFQSTGTNADEGKNTLPTLEGDEGLARDPYDVTKPEDLVDGKPLDEERFWKRVRLTSSPLLISSQTPRINPHPGGVLQMTLRKLLLSLLLGAILALQSVSLGLSITDAVRTDIAVYALHTAFALYLLVLAGRSVNAAYGAHERAVVHLSALTWLAVMLLGTTAILPSTPFPLAPSSLVRSAIEVGAGVKGGAPLGVWYAVLGLYVGAFVLVVTTPRGPKLHFPSEAIYADKTLMQITSKYEDNVDGITGVCSLSSRGCFADLGVWMRRRLDVPYTSCSEWKVAFPFGVRQRPLRVLVGILPDR